LEDRRGIMKGMEPEYINCFACGKDNPIGLHLNFRYEDLEAISEWDCPKEYCGYPDVIHGGIISTMLDEAMAKAILINEGVAVTGKMTTIYRTPLKSGTGVIIVGKIEKIKGNVIIAKAVIKDKEQIYAEAEAVYIKVG
jgi:acyl-coenzyme A thioesterase PaaI-like protein